MTTPEAHIIGCHNEGSPFACCRELPKPTPSPEATAGRLEYAIETARMKVLGKARVWAVIEAEPHQVDPKWEAELVAAWDKYVPAIVAAADAELTKARERIRVLETAMKEIEAAYFVWNDLLDTGTAMQIIRNQCISALHEGDVKGVESEP